MLNDWCAFCTGSELVTSLRTKYGKANVIASDVKAPEKKDDGPFVTLVTTSGFRAVPHALAVCAGRYGWR